MFRIARAAVYAFLCLALGAPSPAEWWRHAVFYEIYPRSFQDTKGDGVGDLNGITARLDYLQDLGVDAVWLTPIFPSPQVDFGYDVSDYRDIDPRFGTLRAFDRLVAEGRRRGIRVVLDLVLNHTSDQHPWFKDSRSSRKAERRDWYVWRDGKGAAPPCNWVSLFGGPAWTLDPATGQFYYHFFYGSQPDLNWRNPAVRDEMLDVTRWWYRRGVAGFRLDALDTVFEDPALTDNPLLPGRNAFGDPNTRYVHNYKLDEGRGLMRALRREADPFGAVLIGETYTESTEELRGYYGDGRDQLQMPTGHMLAMADKLSAPDFRKRIAATEATGFWPVWVLGNHDLARIVSRFGDKVHDDAIAKAMGTLLLTLRGTPILYYGDELGMVNTDPARREDVKDAMGRAGWPTAKRRDGERTPMQWDTSPAAGFTTGRPWLPVPPGSRSHNVATERRDPGSVLNWHRAFLALRRSRKALLDGAYRPLVPDDPDILAYLRVCDEETILVAVNLSGKERKLDLGVGATGQVLLATGSAPAQGLPAALGPYCALVATLGKSRTAS